MRYFLMLLIMTGFSAYPGFAQERQFISGSFSDASFGDFVKSVEKQTNYRFYFIDSLLKKVKVTIDVKNAYPESVLTKIFEETDFEFTIDAKSRVFITHNKPLSLRLPPDFFEGAPPPDVTSKKPPAPRNETAGPAQVESAVENKIFEIGTPGGAGSGSRSSISGYVRNADNGEELSGVNIHIDGTRVNVTTDQFGYYSLRVTPGRHTINFSFMGTFDTRRQVIVYADGRLDVDMRQKILQLKEVVIEPEKERNIRSSVMGMERLNIAAIKQIPAVMGETDILRVVQNLPGVKTVGEASTGMNVRGGAADQNLILFNDMNIYNPSHLFGFFSAINPDVIKDVNLYKSSIPAKFGGRISSVLDITSLDGNDKKLTGSARIGLLTGSFALNGPLKKEKTTFVLGARSTYSDWILQLLPKEYENAGASFHDLTAHISHRINKKNQIYLNGYFSKDRLTMDAYTRYQYKNLNANAKWKHNLNSRFYSVFGVGFDHYTYTSKDSVYQPQAYVLEYQIRQCKAKADFNYFLSNSHTLSFGLSSQLYEVMPGRLTPWNHSMRVPDTLQQEKALESAVYVSDNFQISDRLTLEAGGRLNVYNTLGSRSVYLYADGLPKETENITGVKDYANGEIMSTRVLPDVRAGIRYMLSSKSSLKASVNTLNQFIHLISNTATATPTDIWKLSDNYLAPQQGSQVSLGLYRNLKSNTIETSIEVYYKWLRNYADYKSGAKLLMNKHLETDLVNTKGKAYGAELFVKKSTGKLNGWISYTWSRAFTKQDDELAGELINSGNYYPSNFDQPHAVALISNYKFSHRFSVSMNVNYSTGRPITLPIGTFDYEGAPRVLYSDRNAYRIPDYFRTDLSVNIEGNHKVKQLTHNSWTVGVYNATARKNAYSVYFITEEGSIKGYKLSVFGTAIPYITYNIRF